MLGKDMKNSLLRILLTSNIPYLGDFPIYLTCHPYTYVPYIDIISSVVILQHILVPPPARTRHNIPHSFMHTLSARQALDIYGVYFNLTCIDQYSVPSGSLRSKDSAPPLR